MPTLHLMAKGKDGSLTLRIGCGASSTKTPLLDGFINRIDINPQWIMPRSIVKKSIIHRLGNTGWFASHFTDRHTSSGHLYLLRIPGIGVDRRNALIVQMAERGIATNVHFKPLPMMTAYKNMGFDIADFPNAYHQYENEITLPLNTKLSDEDVEYIINNLLEILHE